MNGWRKGWREPPPRRAKPPPWARDTLALPQVRKDFYAEHPASRALLPFRWQVPSSRAHPPESCPESIFLPLEFHRGRHLLGRHCCLFALDFERIPPKQPHSFFPSFLQVSETPFFLPLFVPLKTTRNVPTLPISKTVAAPAVIPPAPPSQCLPGAPGRDDGGPPPRGAGALDGEALRGDGARPRGTPSLLRGPLGTPPFHMRVVLSGFVARGRHVCRLPRAPGPGPPGTSGADPSNPVLNFSELKLPAQLLLPLQCYTKPSPPGRPSTPRGRTLWALFFVPKE